MTELRPILGDDPTDEERRLLDSARLDVPPRAGRRRTLAAMGLAAAVTTTAGTGGAAATTASAGLIIKWMALGAIGGTIALGATGALTPLVKGWGPRAPAVVVPRPAPASLAGKLSTYVPPAAPVEVQPPRAAAQLQAPRADAPVQRDARSGAPPTSPSRPLARGPEPSRLSVVVPSLPVRPLHDPAIVPSPDDTLTAEVTALDEARRALAASDPGLALLSLDSYDRRFALRRLGPEASVLRLEALLAEGRADQARQLGDQLLAAEPEGAYAQRVRSLLSGASQ